MYWLWRAISIFLDQAKFVNQWFHMVMLFTSIPCSAVSFLEVHEWRDISQVLPNLINWASHAMLKAVGRWGRLSFDPFFSFKNKNYGDWFFEMHMFHAFALPTLPLGICTRVPLATGFPPLLMLMGHPILSPITSWVVLGFDNFGLWP